jgi:2-hydroxychromene-2-carboxylate isomerase
MHTASAPRLSPHDERAVAVKAGVDPRTVRAYLEGKPQRSTAKARIQEALEALGLAGAPRTAEHGAQ